MGKGTPSDARWLSAFQGRLINFEKRRKVSGCRPSVLAGGWGGGRGVGNQRPASAASCFLLYLWGELDTQRRGDLSHWRGVQEARIKDSFLGGAVLLEQSGPGRE